MADGDESRESVPLASVVAFGLQEGRNELRGIWNKMFKVLIYGSDGEDGILSHIGVSMFQA